MDRILQEIVVKGNVQQFLKLITSNPNLINQIVTGSSNTILHLAARFGHVDLATKILKICPEMLLSENKDMETPLHEACREGKVEMTNLFLGIDPSVAFKVNFRGESALFVAAERGRVDVVKRLMEFPELLTLEVDVVTSTSLHVAASAGHTEIVREILKKRPDFAKKTTIDGCSPLHQACSKGHLDTTRELLSLDPDLTFLQDEEGKTPLHWAASKGRVNVIDEILSTSRDSSNMLTKNGETVLHLAVRNNQFDSVRYMMERLDVTKLMNMQDNDGNTILHLATAGKLRSMVIYLLKLGVEVNAVNRKGYTALDVVESDPSNSGTIAIVPALLETGAKRCDQLLPKSREIQQVPSPEIFQPNIYPYDDFKNSPKKRHHHKHRSRSKQLELQNEGIKNARNTVIIVAVLIATVTFAAGINPPGGYNQLTGKAIMGKDKAFKVFMVCNIVALFLSLGIVNVLVSVVPFRRKLMMRLLVMTHKVMWVSTLFMALAYIAAVWTIMPHGKGSTWVLVELVVVGGGLTVMVFLVLGFLLVRQWSNKREWRKRNENRSKDGSRSSSLNSKIVEMKGKKSRESSSNSDLDSASDHGFVLI